MIKQSVYLRIKTPKYFFCKFLCASYNILSCDITNQYHYYESNDNVKSTFPGKSLDLRFYAF